MNTSRWPLLSALALVLSLASGCHTPADLSPGPIGIKSIHTRTHACGHYAALPAPEATRAR